jgi:hypothetical protein
MILYKAKSIMGRLILKRFLQIRGSNKGKKVHDKLRNYRKLWWHFKTKWDPDDNN